MGLIVQKYGGSSLDSPEKITNLAERIIARYDSGDRLVIVVSAVGKTTDGLEAKAYALSDNPDPREVDMLVSVGERESVSLMAIAINNIRPGLAVSFTGSQIGLITDNNHGNARILEIKGDRLVEALSNGKIPIIAGFQGVSTEKEITTLGRGGSDTTAVAVTAALKADVCEIYSDVAGVYSADPKLCPEAVLINELDYDTMLTISSLGAKVLRDAAVEYAKRLGVKIATGLSSDGYTGTIISNSAFNNRKITSVIYNDRLCFKHLPPGIGLPDDISKIRFFQSGGSGSLVVFDPEFGKNGEKCFSVAVAGTGIRSEKNKLSEMKKILELTNEIFGFDLSDLKSEFFLKKCCSASDIKKIHSLFFA